MDNSNRPFKGRQAGKYDRLRQTVTHVNNS